MKNAFLEKEIHLAIIWEKGRNKEDEIIDLISDKFEIIEQYKIKWNKKFFNKSLSSFYGTNLPANSKKEKHCGIGEFLLITFYDNKPIYDLVETSRGFEKANINVFNIKKKLRELTGGGHKIHTTNTPKETNHDLTLLFGVNYKDYEKLLEENKNNLNQTNNVMNELMDKIVGVDGWKDLDQLFYVLNNTVDYVILRNFEDYPHTIEDHDDIDFLVKDLNQVVHVTNAIRIFEEENRVHYKIKVSNKYILVDFRHAGDDYYDYKWQENILKNKVLTKKNFFVPSGEDYFYSLVYHVLFHKFFIAKDYPIKLKKLFKNLINFDETKCNFSHYLELLEKFLKKNNYSAIEPKDTSVYFDKKFLYYKKIINQLSLNGMHNVSPYLVEEWKNVSKFLYFVAINNEKEKIFIKTGGFFDSVRREFRIIRELNNINNKLFPKLFFYKLTKELKCIAMEHVEGVRLDKLIETSLFKAKNAEFIRNLYEGIYNILIALHNVKIVHRDIRPENIIVQKNGIPILIDFQFAVDVNRKVYKEYKDVLKNPKHLVTLGREYKKDRYHWDDAFSIKKIYEKLNVENDVKFINLQKKIENLIGKYEIISVRKNIFSKYIVLIKNYIKKLRD